MDRRAQKLLAMAAGCAALFALVVVAAYWWGPGRSLDLQGLTGFVSLNDGWVAELTIRLTQLGNPPEVAAMTLVFAALALVRGRPRVAVTVVALVAATSVSSQLLKALLGHPRYAPVLGWVVGPEALPSGHATAAMSLTLAAVIAAPRRARLAAAVVGSSLALGVGGAVVAWGWHYPSDVLAGYLLATGWALALVAALYEADARAPAAERWTGTAIARASDRIATGGLALAAAGIACAVVLAGAAVALADPGGATCFARENTAFVVVAGGIASAAVALPVTMAAVARRG